MNNIVQSELLGCRMLSSGISSCTSPDYLGNMLCILLYGYMIRMMAGKGGECPGQRKSYHTLGTILYYLFLVYLYCCMLFSKQVYLCFLYVFVLLTYIYNLLAGNIIQLYSWQLPTQLLHITCIIIYLFHSFDRVSYVSARFGEVEQLLE